jgi:PKD repeat protein
MKQLSTILKTLVLLIAISFAGEAKAQLCSANYSYSIGAGGAVTFTSTGYNSTTVTPVSYYWNFGGGNTFTATGSPNAIFTFSANGVYVVNLFVLQSNPTCSASISYSIMISNAGGCALNANFNYTQGGNGLVNFNNTSSGTLPGVTYSWNFGDNTALNTTTSPAHTYSANGTYVATLVATNNATCVSTKTLAINVNTYCNLVASFSSTNGANGLVNFASSSTGTTGSTSYAWKFGDGGTATGVAPSHVYINGSYQATLTVSSSSVLANCIDTIVNPIVVTNNTCNISANFSSTVNTGGNVSFNSTSAGTNGSTTYTWNFGNGFTSNSASPNVTYLSGGVYYVTLIASNASNCTSTITKTVNVTGIPCVANANFTLVPTNTPQFWTAIPSYPWNVSTASWSWGDNSVSNFSLYAAHQYSTAGLYNICLTVTASCGATASSCATYSVFRSSAAAAIINVNVLAPTLKSVDNNNAVGLKDLQAAASVNIYPNPSTGLFNVRLNGLESETSTISVFNLVGDLLYTQVVETTGGQLNTDLSLNNASNGIYFLQVTSGSKTLAQKLVISK